MHTTRRGSVSQLSFMSNLETLQEIKLHDELNSLSLEQLVERGEKNQRAALIILTTDSLREKLGSYNEEKYNRSKHTKDIKLNSGAYLYQVAKNYPDVLRELAHNHSGLLHPDYRDKIAPSRISCLPALSGGLGE